MPAESGKVRGTSAEGFRIERGSVARLAEVQALAATCQDGPRWSSDAWRRLVDLPSGGVVSGLLLLALSEAGELCGWLAASRVCERSELEYVLVQPMYRGRGVAGRLLGEWMGWAHTQGVTEAMLEVRSSNASARRLYQAWGFAEQGRRRNYYEQPLEDAVLMGRAM